ncbi:PrsW family intramembrane metalloprotease [Trichormus variabilis ARAD]|nr:PrsW family intramembrane metalloprotease [Trichormus variabilis ARAD]MBC1257945.1 PrsW family intramembrane metalloprotease [Trichormus variabilis V5]MBC1269661.1 PrsW family intramembrane metalloprotease [Trichormus variabilis FSR]MBC1304965.1 PrsW family intramembrane metalloprotease [Trichormus variabilis N2B]MBC1313041.1 PrsW family intramembrane metalloprotease [Trichormus variabilis PNB]MBC1329228.1 PrsW family intramembrane metalloprotease [Trichormus variabilis 9RC]MBD2381255.1 Pr
MSLYFQPQGITVKASIKNSCLQLMLESEQVPDKPSSVAFIRQELSTWQPALITNVRIYGLRTDQSFPDWEETFSLIRQQSETATFLAALRTFKFASVVPYQDVFSAELYSNNTVKLLLFFGLFPLGIGLIANSSNLEQTAWLLGIYYASIWGVVLYNLIKPAWFSWRETLKCIVFTAIVGIPLLLLIQQFPLFQLLYAATESNLGLIPQLIGFIFGVGVLEEICKALPVYLFLLRPRKLNEPLTGAFYGAMSGLGFAIAEGGSYSLLYAFNLVRGQSGFGTYILVNTIRFVSLPLFHAILAGIVGYFLGLAAINRSRQLPIMFIGVALAAVLHGSYNTFSDGILGLVIISFTILLFVAYLRRSQQMVTEMQQAELERLTLPQDKSEN